MNRHDAIQAQARDIASNIHADPELRDAMADGLIKLIGLMINATGKYVAGYGERKGNEVHDWIRDEDQTPEEAAEFEAEQARDIAIYHGIYLTGERMQSEVDEIVAKCINPKVDLDRYHRVTGDEWCVCGHHPDSHIDGICIGLSHNKQACTPGPCQGFVAKLREPVWVHVDRRPVHLHPLVDPGNVDRCPNECCYPVKGD